MQNYSLQNNLTLDVGSSVVRPLQICWNHIIKNSDSQLHSNGVQSYAALKGWWVMQGSVVAQRVFRKLTVIHEQNARKFLPLLA